MEQHRDEHITCVDCGTTFVFSTHDPKIMGEAEVTFTLDDGRLQTRAGREAAGHA